MKRPLKEFQISRSQTNRPREIAVVGRRDPDKELPKGMRLEVITSEHPGTGEEPYMHLFPASHETKIGKSNNYDLITRVKITEDRPLKVEDVVAIKDNKPIPKEYQKAIFEWSQKTTKRGHNNWIFALSIWDAINDLL